MHGALLTGDANWIAAIKTGGLQEKVKTNDKPRKNAGKYGELK